jgi:hypothetical protein
MVVVFVEKFYLTLRHGLTITYQAGKQRFYALLCRRITGTAAGNRAAGSGDAATGNLSAGATGAGPDAGILTARAAYSKRYRVWAAADSAPTSAAADELLHRL